MTTKLQLQLQRLQCFFRKTANCNCNTSRLQLHILLQNCNCSPPKGGYCTLQWLLFVIGGKWASASPTLHHNFTTGTFAWEKKNEK